MLKYKLLRGTVLIIIAFGVLSAVVGMQFLADRVLHEAQNRVRLDLSSAWAVYQGKLDEIETVLRLTAIKRDLVEAMRQQQWADESSVSPELRTRLDRTRLAFDLDFLTVTDADGKVVIRTGRAAQTGDYAPNKPAILRALGGEATHASTLFAEHELAAEADGLVDRAYIDLRETERARPTPRQIENRGLVMLAAVPIEHGGVIVGSLYAGVLLNRNTRMVDRIQEVVYHAQPLDDQQQPASPGTVTIFLHDTRIATTVLAERGARAYGTRVSRDVADWVLDTGQTWIGRAFVIQDYYLTAYGPIRNLQDEIVGMLYVGIPEAPFRQLRRALLVRYMLLSAGGLLAACVFALWMAGRLTQPLHKLARASERMRHGDYPESVTVSRHASRETESLVRAFNDMSQALRRREIQLTETNARLEDANTALQTVNRNYMETLQFVTHELKSPVASMVNYVYLLKQNMLGELNEQQLKAIDVLDRNMKRLSEMIRHYLNLARIENDEMNPRPERVDIVSDVLQAVVDSIEHDGNAKQMVIESAVPEGIACNADVNMTREVFENLVGNAVKYGREGGRIRIAAGPADAAGFIEFSVWNEGPGFSEDLKPLLFRKFSRLEEGGRQKRKGTGLGLFITRRIVEAHGGAVAADSAPGEWAEFRFTLPTHEQPKQNHSGDEA